MIDANTDRAERRLSKRAFVLERARRWRDGSDRRLWSTVDLAEKLGVPAARLSALLSASVMIEPTDAEIKILDELLAD